MIVIDGLDMPKGEDSRLCVDIYPSGKVCINLDMELKQIATASEPKHGRWNYIYYDNIPMKCACSECGAVLYFDNRDNEHKGSNYCPNCGADMRELEE